MPSLQGISLLLVERARDILLLFYACKALVKKGLATIHYSSKLRGYRELRNIRAAKDHIKVIWISEERLFKFAKAIINGKQSSGCIFQISPTLPVLKIYYWDGANENQYEVPDPFSYWHALLVCFATLLINYREWGLRKLYIKEYIARELGASSHLSEFILAGLKQEGAIYAHVCSLVSREILRRKYPTGGYFLAGHTSYYHALICMERVRLSGVTALQCHKKSPNIALRLDDVFSCESKHYPSWRRLAFDKVLSKENLGPDYWRNRLQVTSLLESSQFARVNLSTLQRLASDAQEKARRLVGKYELKHTNNEKFGSLYANSKGMFKLSALGSNAKAWIVYMANFWDEQFAWGDDSYYSSFEFMLEITNVIQGSFPDDVIIIRTHPEVIRPQHSILGFKEEGDVANKKDIGLEMTFIERISRYLKYFILVDQKAEDNAAILNQASIPLTRTGSIGWQAPILYRKLAVVSESSPYSIGYAPNLVIKRSTDKRKTLGLIRETALNLSGVDSEMLLKSVACIHTLWDGSARTNFFQSKAWLNFESSDGRLKLPPILRNNFIRGFDLVLDRNEASKIFD